MSSTNVANEKNEGRHPSGKPIQARDRLLAGVQEIMHLTSSGHAQANDVMLHMLETLYSSMGFRFATICLKDAKTGEYRSRISLGDDAARRRTGMIFTVTGQRDLFKLAMDSDADLMSRMRRIPRSLNYCRRGIENFFPTPEALSSCLSLCKKIPWDFSMQIAPNLHQKVCRRMKPR
jgi:hypothetical protein